LSSPSRLRLFYLLHLSKPVTDRIVFREIRRLKARKIVELGIGTGERALRMLELAGEYHGPSDLHYVGIDLFEDRPASNGPGLSLKEAHRLLKASGARIQLAPGTPLEGLAREANRLGKVDLIVVSPQPNAQQLAYAWFYIPRLLHEQSVVLLETSDQDENPSVRVVDRAEIELLAGMAGRQKAA
jgi:hypothetical protein